MASITTATGLISGIDSKSIIDQLISLESQSKTLLQRRVDSTTSKKVAFTDLMTRLSSLKLVGTTLKKDSSFQAANTQSGDENVLTASASNGAAIGSYQFQVARLVTTQQSVSNGFADFDKTSVGAGTITLEQGGGELVSQTALSELNGGKGIARGQFRITDRSGATTVIDTTAAVTVDDVLKKINTSLDVSVKATINNDRIVLTDLTGKTTSKLIVQDLGAGTSAADLGLAGNSSSNTLTGSDINYLSRDTAINALNDTRGLRTKGGTSDDFRVTTRDGSTFDVSVSSAKSIGDVLDAINTASAGKVTASIPTGSNHLSLADNTTGLGSFGVASLAGSKAAEDLGLTTGASGGTITGDTILSPIDSVLLTSLNGGQGLSMGTISIKDRSGASTSVNLAGSKTVQDILAKINAASGINVTAGLKSSQNGISLTDDSGATGSLVISDVSGTTAAALGIAGSFGLSVKSVDGANLQKQWVTTNTLLAGLNGGKGIARGKFKITNASGVSAQVDLSQGDEISVSNVLAEINSKGLGVTASVNAHGDGLLLTDTSGGAGKLTVTDIDSSTAADLNIKGEATGTTIDGSWEKSITILATDRLADVQTKINNAGYGVSASIINDGSNAAPYRLSMTARNSGRGGRVVIDGGTTAVRAQTLVESQDAAVFLGGSDTPNPLLITASKNQLSGVIPGVTIDLHGVSSSPVSLNVTRSADNVVAQLKQYVETFNGMVDKINDLTSYDTTTNTGALLLGDSTVQQVQQTIYSVMGTVVNTGGKYRLMADIGVTLDDKSKIAFDEEKFRAAYADDPGTVSKLFGMSTSKTADGKTTTTYQGFAGVLEARMTTLIDPSNGVIAQTNKSLDAVTAQFNDRITQMDAALAIKRARLEQQFANMESVLAGLQSQQSALSSFTGISPSSSKR